jgi:hypothetical protein
LWFLFCRRRSGVFKPFFDRWQTRRKRLQNKYHNKTVSITPPFLLGYLPLTLSAYLMRSIVMESSVLESHVAVGCFAGNHVSRGSGSHERLIFGCPTRDRHVPCHVAVPSVGSLWGRYQIRSLVRIQELGPGPPPISTYIRLWSLPKASGHNSP